MNEHQRREYLQAMGIIQYVPRWVLPGAKISRPIELPVAALEPQPPAVSGPAPEPAMPLPEPETIAPPRQPRPSETPASVGAVVTGLVESLSPTRKAPATPGATTALPDSSLQPFALSIWRPSAALLVLDERPSGQALPTQALLHNMLHAKGITLAASPPDVLRWPPLAGQPAGTWAAATEMTLAFLQARLELQPAPYLWLMGERAYRAVMADGKPYAEALGQALNLEALGTLALVLPSLSDMLRQPQLKAITWSAIRPHHVR